MKTSPRTAGLLLMLYLVLAGVWIWRLSPTAPPPPDTWRMDQQEKAAVFLAKAPKGTAMPALMRLPKLPDDQLQAMGHWLDLPPLEQLRQLTVQEGAIAILGSEWGEALLQTWLARDLPVNLIEAHLMVAAAGDRLNEEAKHQTLEALASTALRHGDPAEAVIILGRACEMPGASWDTLMQLTRACRAARATTPALKALTLWIKRHADTATDERLDQACDMELSLMLDAGHQSEALSLQLSRLTTGPYYHRDLDRAWIAAQHAHQGSQFLPVLERHLATFPEHDLTLDKLAAQKETSPEYLRWLACHAAICDEEQPATLAFTSYLRLAAARVAIALPRLCALASTTEMKAQTEKALHDALSRAETQMTVLQLGQTDPLARRVVESRLRQTPQNRDLHYAATSAASSAQKTGSAAVLWQDFLRRFPRDESAQRRLIQTYLQEQQPALALRIYAELPAKALTEEDKRQQQMLKQL